MNIKSSAEIAAEALEKLVRELEHNLEEGESICVSGMGPNCSEFFLQKFGVRGNLVTLMGDADDSRFEQLVFAPDQISIRLFTAKRSGTRTRVGFDVK